MTDILFDLVEDMVLSPLKEGEFRPPGGLSTLRAAFVVSRSRSSAEHFAGFFFGQHVSVSALAAVGVLLDVDALKCGGEPREGVDAFLGGGGLLRAAPPPPSPGRRGAPRAGGKGAFDRDAAFGLFERDELGVPADELVVRGLRLERTLREEFRTEHLLLEGLHVARLVEVVHFLAEAADRVARVAPSFAL